jgi:cell division septum initiation protein DivIVA
MEPGADLQRRVFPPVHEGYDRGAVGAYLQALAAEVETLTRASGALHDRVRALSGELDALAASVSTEAELPAALERATPTLAAPAVSRESPAAVERPAASPALPAVSPEPLAAVELSATSSALPAVSPALPSQVSPSPASPSPAVPPAGDDLDGARLVALNMALGGEPREQADRYLAERFRLADRARLLDEVYAAVEG